MGGDVVARLVARGTPNGVFVGMDPLGADGSCDDVSTAARACGRGGIRQPVAPAEWCDWTVPAWVFERLVCRRRGGFLGAGMSMGGRR